MPPPVAVYVVAAAASLAALIAFKEYVYEPHIAPKVEAWAEGFLERRRAARNRRASAVSVRTSRHRRNSSPSSVSSLSHHSNDADRPVDPIHPALDEHELEALASKEVDEWRNEVLRSQERTQDGLRHRRTHRPRDVFDGFDTSTTLDESFTSLTHTPLESTHVISNVSSPITASTLSLPSTPNKRPRTVSQSTTTQASASFVNVSHSPSTPAHGARATTPTSSTVPTPRPFSDGSDTSPLAIPIPIRRQSSVDGVPHPLPFTPTYQVMADDSPFGPIFPDTPRSSAEMYGERPFSPIARMMGPSHSVSQPGPNGTSSSMADSTHSLRSLGGSGTLRKRSGLANELIAGNSDDGSDPDPEQHPHVSSMAGGVNGSVISSLSERYPAPPTPPVIVSPPASSVGMISPPLSPHSSGSEVVVHDVPRYRPSLALPSLQLPPEASLSASASPGLVARSRSSDPSAVSPALSYASFLSPMPVSRTASESEGDEFMSVASDDSWGASPLSGPAPLPLPDRARPRNPFLELNGHRRSESGSEGSEVLVSVSDQGASEVGSEGSWGSARRH